MENRIDKKESFDVEMPKSISIGDPMYFEEYGEDFKYVYSKKFRSRGDWLGKVIVTEEVNLKMAKEFGKEYPSLYVFATFAPNQELLDTYEKRQYLKTQRTRATQIGVDTARYIMQVEDRYVEIGTGSDGLMGDVVEILNGNKLEGIMIDLTALDVNLFGSFLEEMKYVFKG